MKIRELTIEEYDEIVKFWSRADLPFKPRGRDSREALRAQLKENPEFFLGAFVHDHLVGTVVMSCDMRKGWINRLAVDPDYRKSGIAKALIAECERIFRKSGIRIFCVLIENYNIASKRLFKECGYVEHHDIIYFSRRDSDEV